MNLIKKNIWNFQKCCRGYKPYYNYGDYVYFNNSIDAPKKHHNHFIVNHKPILYNITIEVDG